MSQSQQIANLESLLLIPAVSSDDITDADWDKEMRRMFEHTKNVRSFVTGQISPQDFEDSIASLGWNPYELEDMWSEGISLGN